MGICGERWKLNGARYVIRGEQEYVDSKGGAWRKEIGRIRTFCPCSLNKVVNAAPIPYCNQSGMIKYLPDFIFRALRCCLKLNFNYENIRNAY